MSLPERLEALLVKLRESFDDDLPDPATLEHSGEIQARGQTYTARSSAPLADLANEDAFTLYLHTQPMDGQEEHLRYVHFENRSEMTSIMIRLDMIDGALRQNVTLSSLPREMFMRRVDQMTGRGAPRERPPRRNNFAGAGGRPNMKPARWQQNNMDSDNTEEM